MKLVAKCSHGGKVDLVLKDSVREELKARIFSEAVHV